MAEGEGLKSRQVISLGVWPLTSTNLLFYHASPGYIFNLLDQGHHVSLVDHLSAHLSQWDLHVKPDETIAWLVILDLNWNFAEVPWKLHIPLMPPNSLWMWMNINECNSACCVRGHLVSSAYSILWPKYCIYLVNCVRCFFQNPNKQLNMEGGSPSSFFKAFSIMNRKQSRRSSQSLNGFPVNTKETPRIC